VIQRVIETPVNRVGYAQISAMTLRDFHQHAQAQVDWFNTPDISDEQRRQLRALLTFALPTSILSGCGDMLVSALLSSGVITSNHAVNRGIAGELGDYSRAVSQSEGATIQIQNPTTDPAIAREWGRAIRRLEGLGISGDDLYKVIQQDGFEQLIRDHQLDAFIRYVRGGARIEAENGMDVTSFLALCGEDNPLTLANMLRGHVVNVHRFEAAALRQLATNLRQRNRPQSQRKPLTLILHTARDHNGAFHRDPNVTQIFTNTNITAIMIEGKETLDEVRGELEGLAAAYGQNGKIDQVMFAGHGNARSIELGSDPGQSVDLDSNAEDSNDLFDEILRLMPNDPAAAPHRRIIFNACLTNSNSVTVPLDSDPAVAAAEVRAHVAANSSLATFLQQRAIAQGLNNIDVRGANGSIGQVQLIDSGNGLDIISSTDPAVTSEKIDYVEQGDEPEGVLRAVLECWAGVNAPDPNARKNECHQRMQARVAAGAGGWRQTIIRTLFQLILDTYWSNGEKIRQLADTAYALSESELDAECRVNLVAHDGKLGPGESAAGDAGRVIGAVIGSAPANYTRLVLNEVWMRIDNAKRADFMGSLSAFNCQTAADYLDVPFIKPELPQLIPVNPTPTREQILVAARVIDTDQSDQSARNFLLGIVDTASRRFPTALNMAAILAGRPDEQSILVALGLAGSGPTPPTDVNANLDLDGDGRNETFINPLPGLRGRATERIAMYGRPDPTSALPQQIGRAYRVFVIGQTGTYYAIHNPFQARQVVFVEKDKIDTSS
jgi:hypothetical protein